METFGTNLAQITEATLIKNKQDIINEQQWLEKNAKKIVKKFLRENYFVFRNAAKCGIKELFFSYINFGLIMDYNYSKVINHYYNHLKMLNFSDYIEYLKPAFEQENLIIKLDDNTHYVPGYSITW